MNFDELFAKYQTLQRENRELRKEVSALKGEQNQLEKEVDKSLEQFEAFRYSQTAMFDNLDSGYLVENKAGSDPGINKYSSPQEKIQVFRSLFRGRDDVYAKRWESKTGRWGYSPDCSNLWKKGVCPKPNGKCQPCKHKAYIQLSDEIIEDHLKNGDSVIGVFPMLLNEHCWLLAIDFDEEDWQKDIDLMREICTNHDIPVAV